MMAQTTLQTFLCELHENCNLLKEREAKYDDIAAPVYLLNQLRDYEIAIERATQTLKESLSLDDLQAKFNTIGPSQSLAPPDDSGGKTTVEPPTPQSIRLSLSTPADDRWFHHRFLLCPGQISGRSGWLRSRAAKRL